jgi:hypothetical protein
MKEKIYTTKDELIIRIPLKQKRWNAYDEEDKFWL